MKRENSPAMRLKRKVFWMKHIHKLTFSKMKMVQMFQLENHSSIKLSRSLSPKRFRSYSIVISTFQLNKQNHFDTFSCHEQILIPNPNGNKSTVYN